MANTIKLKRSNTSGSAPTAAQLDTGEVALNMADRLLYFKDPSANIKSLDIADLNSFDTDDLVEGATNEYYTDAKARSAISAGGDLTYSAATGIMSFTERTDAEVRGLISASGDLTYTAATGVISFTERTDAEVRGLISAGGDLSYSAATGVMSFTERTDAEVRGLISASGDITYTAATGVISYTESVNSVNSQTGAVVLELGDLDDVTGIPNNGDVISYNSTSGNWETGAPASGGLANVVEDTTPQLGGDLDLNSNDITGTGNIDITGGIDTTGPITNSATSFGTVIVASRSDSQGTYGLEIKNTKTTALASGDLSTAAGFTVQGTASTAYPGFIYGEYNTAGNRIHNKLYDDGVSSFTHKDALNLGQADAQFFDNELQLSTDGIDQTIRGDGGITLEPGTGSGVTVDSDFEVTGSTDTAGLTNSASAYSSTVFANRTNASGVAAFSVQNTKTSTLAGGDSSSGLTFSVVGTDSTAYAGVINGQYNPNDNKLFFKIYDDGVSTFTTTEALKLGQTEADFWEGDFVVETDGTDQTITPAGSLTVAGDLVLQGFQETANTPATTGTIAPDPSSGTYGVITLTGNITFNAFTNATAGQSYTLVIKQPASGGPYTLTSSMLFSGGNNVLSVAANAVDVMTVFYDGTNYYASLTNGYA